MSRMRPRHGSAARGRVCENMIAMRRASLAHLAPLALLCAPWVLGGCLPPGFSQLCPGDGTCTAQFTFVVEQIVVDSQVTIATDRGCVDFGSECLATGLVLCGFTHHGVYTIVTRCGECIVAEWPDGWTLTSATWSAASVPASGQIVVAPALAFALPPSFGPIVTDAGMSAHVLRLDTDALPAHASVSASLRFQRGGAPGACVKALEVALITFAPGGQQYLVPTEGLGTSFVALAAPDPHVLCVAADPATAASRASWGGLKAIYRAR
jgi:hypothetical protein